MRCGRKCTPLVVRKGLVLQKHVKVKQCCQKQMCIIRYSSFILAPRGRRGWKKFYAVLKGTILYLQKVTVVDYPICCFMLSPKQSFFRKPIHESRGESMS